MLSRRTFIAASTALAAHPGVASERHSYTTKDYERAMVIDALGAVSDPEPDAAIETEPSARLLKDLRESGLTAVSVTLSVGSTGDRMAKAIRRIATLNEKIAAAPDLLMRIRTAADLTRAKDTRRLGLIYNVQDTSLLENDLSRVTTLRAMGLRVMQMTYNTRNLVGDGCLERADSGLSNLGRELVAELGRTRVVMDLSHSGRATIAEAIREARMPPVISHTGCRDLHDHPRNVYDTELRALAAKGGVAGIYFMPFLVPRGNASKDDLIRHIEHAVNVCGEDHVGLGTDGNVSATLIDDGYRKYLREEYESRVAQGIAAPGEGPEVHQFILDYNHPRRFFTLAQDLAARGWPARRIDKLLGGNFARVYAEVWG
ncbi:dipeptidase [Steroidobacter cummioxidans]|uniref:dipeptidase n=1 Tax=Steroidobacter cummioxidans TaxID=1803913 RepID=UPI000E311583|nr:membrane dipeptidase [Steroidobacter cummioxidans]